MGFIPSIRLSKNLDIATIGVWPEELSCGVALVCKMPATAIKALYTGARCSLFLAVIRAESLDVLCVGLQVNDEPEHPFAAMLPNTAPEDAPLIEQLLTADSVTLLCLNELNHLMLTATCVMQRSEALMAAESLRATPRWVLTPSSKDVERERLSRALSDALDVFAQYVFRDREKVLNPQIVVAAEVPLTVDVRLSTDMFEITARNGDGAFAVEDAPEGPEFERLVYLAIDGAHPRRSYLCPQVEHGRSTRELADILAFDEESICVVQAKALSVLHVARDRPSSRRSATVTKDVEAAMSQLNGAMKKIRSAARIFTKDGVELTLPTRGAALAHAIVIVSEMYAFVDWRAVAAAAIEASENEQRRALVQVMDLQELSALTSRCPNSRTFFERLVERWVQVKARGTSYVRTKVFFD